MEMEPKTGKRVVSKREYVRFVLGRIGFGVHSIMVTGLGVVCLASGFYCLIFCFGPKDYQWYVQKPIWFFFAAAFSLCGVRLMRFVMSEIQQAAQEPKIVPLTRANTGDLPAPESLVRTSAKPVQAQETVLLRAATPGQQTPAEQLVRPAGGQEENG